MPNICVFSGCGGVSLLCSVCLPCSSEKETYTTTTKKKWILNAENTCTCTHVHTCTYAHTQAHAHMHTHAHMHIRRHMHTCTHMHMCTYAGTCTHAHTCYICEREMLDRRFHKTRALGSCLFFKDFPLKIFIFATIIMVSCQPQRSSDSFLTDCNILPKNGKHDTLQ